MDYQARAAFIGLSPHHNTGRLRLAILEGICYSLRHSLSYLHDRDPAIEGAVVCGGGTNNETWLNVLSAVIDLPLCRVATNDVAVLGAAILCAHAIESAGTLEEACKRFCRTERAFHPSARLVEYYRAGYQHYVSLANGLVREDS